MPTATKTKITTTKQVGLTEVTLDTITAAATKLGAPSATARVSIGSGVPNVNGEDYLPYSVSFTWNEEV